MTSPRPFSVNVREDGDARMFSVNASGGAHTYRLGATGQQDYLDFYAGVARDFGARMPRNRQRRVPGAAAIRRRPLLTVPLSPGVLYGYGDPAVLWVPQERAWYMVATSNDAPDSFPISRSENLLDWVHVGYAFPRGAKPAWTREGVGLADYWAPELHRVGGAYLLCFTAREADGSLSIGVATAVAPGGPYVAAPAPLLRGGVIDAHVFVAEDGPILFWKDDSNGVWPRRLVRMIADDPAMAELLFASSADRATAALVAALWGWGAGQPPMEQFFMLQPLIEAVVDAFADVRIALTSLGTPDANTILAAMRTPIHARRMAADGSALIGTPRVVLVNDLDWEGHLIEGPWLTRRDGRYYLFYAGNDFSNDRYGIGVAIADDPFGPYRKVREPLLRSDAEWTGPGHPSVAPGADGSPHLFYHAYPPGQAGYKAFRAMLTAPLRFGPDGVEIGG